MLILHGEDDQVVPVGNTARLAIKLVRNGTLETYPSLSHGMAANSSRGHPRVHPRIIIRTTN